MQTIKLDGRIVALDQIAMVEYSENLAKDGAHFVGTCFLKVYEKTTPYIERKHAVPDAVFQSRVTRDFVQAPPGWTIIPIGEGNVAFSITQPEYEKLVWALERYNEIRRD